jgi:hypothetical protein
VTGAGPRVARGGGERRQSCSLRSTEGQTAFKEETITVGPIVEVEAEETHGCTHRRRAICCDAGRKRKSRKEVVEGLLKLFGTKPLEETVAVRRVVEEVANARGPSCVCIGGSLHKAEGGLRTGRSYTAE